MRNTVFAIQCNITSCSENPTCQPRFHPYRHIDKSLPVAVYLYMPARRPVKSRADAFGLLNASFRAHLDRFPLHTHRDQASCIVVQDPM